MARLSQSFRGENHLIVPLFLSTVIVITGCSFFGLHQPIQVATPSNSTENLRSTIWTPIASRTAEVTTSSKSINTEAALNSRSPSPQIPTITPSSTINPLACLPKTTAESYGIVKWVDSGDTIVVDIAGKLQTVNYLGMKSATVKSQIEYYGPPAATQNTALVNGQVVRLIPDGADLDNFGRLRRYVIIYDTEKFANFELIRAGLAKVTTDVPTLACNTTFLKAEEYARQDQLGLWGLIPTSQPTITLKPSNIPSPTLVLTQSSTPGLTPSVTLSLTPTITSTEQTATITPTSTSSPITPSPTPSTTLHPESSLTPQL
jgi:endonuclease YncB( thermonuclease family)